MALPLPAIIDAVETAWDVFTLAQTPPLKAGETFSVKPYLYTSGTYTYSTNGVSYLGQPARLSYADGNMSLTASGEGSFGGEVISGDVTIGYYTPGAQAYTTFSVSSYPDNYFLVSGASYDNSPRQYRSIYVNSRSDAYFSTNLSTNDYLVAFRVDGFGSTNIQNSSGASNATGSHIVPIAPGTQITYNDALNLYINYWKQLYPDWEELDPSDFPTEQEFMGEEPTEPTEGNGNCCNIDYNEIMSPSELESVLNGTDYDLAEIPTIDATFDLPELPSDTIPSSVLAIAGTAMRSSWDFYAATGLAGTMVAVAVIVVLIRMLRGR